MYIKTVAKLAVRSAILGIEVSATRAAVALLGHRRTRKLQLAVADHAIDTVLAFSEASYSLLGKENEELAAAYSRLIICKAAIKENTKCDS